MEALELRSRVSQFGKKLLPAAILSALTATPAMAALNVEDISVRGFGTVALTQGDAEYTLDRGTTDEIQINNESKLGLQFDFKVNDKTSFTYQLVARGNESWEPETEWAFFTYKATDNFSIRAGRLRYSLFMYSEFLEVGYTYPWVSTPSEVYDVVPLNYIDGVDFNYTLWMDDWSLKTQVYAGLGSKKVSYVDDVNPGPLPTGAPGSNPCSATASSDCDLANGTFRSELFTALGDDETQSDDLYGLSLTLSNDIHTLRVGYSSMELTLPSAIPAAINLGIYYGAQGAIAGLQAAAAGINATTGTTGVSAAVDTTFDYLSANSVRYMPVEFYDIAYSYDDGEWLFVTELLESKLDGILADRRGGYITLGRHMGKWMPHITFASAKTIDNDDRDFQGAVPSMTVTAVTPGGTFTDVTRVDLQSQVLHEGFDGERDSVTVGLRYDYSRQTAIKFEVSRLNGMGTTNGLIDSSSGAVESRIDLGTRDSSGGIMESTLDEEAFMYRIAITGVF